MGTLVFQATLGGAVNIIGPNIASTINFTLPSADGSSGQTWTTNGSGVLSFGTLGIGGGGTGQTTATAAFNALAPSQTGNSGKYLTTDGTNTSWATNPLGTVTSVAATVPSFLSIAGSPITTSGTLAFTLSGTALPTTSGGTGLTSFTSGGVVYASSSSALTTGSALTFDGASTYFGIGTASPTQRLHIVSSGNAFARIDSGATSTAGILFNNGNGAFYYDGTSNYLRTDINGSEATRLTSTGLGIGTSSPSYKLQVVKPSAGITARFTDGDGIADIYGYGLEVTRGTAYIKGSSALHLGSAAGYSAVVLDASGNLGLGVTPSAWFSGLKAIQFGTGGVLWSNNDRATLAANLYVDSSTNNRYIADGFALRYAQESGAHTWLASATGLAGNIPTTLEQVLAVARNTSLALQGATSQTGTGITFPATQSASSDANTLDDYEEGTWTPTVITAGGSGSASYSAQNGIYTKTGNTVVATAFIAFTKNTLSGGVLQSGGLPFAANAGTYYPQAACYITAGSLITNPICQVGAGSTASDILKSNVVTGAVGSVTIADLGSGSLELRYTVTYQV